MLSFLPGLYDMNIRWTVLDERVILTGAFIFPHIILLEIGPCSSSQESRCSGARNKVIIGCSQDIQSFNRIPWFTRPMYMPACQFINDEKEGHYFSQKQAKKKEAPQFLRQRDIFSVEYLTLSFRFRFQQNNSFSQLRLRYPKIFRISDKNRPQNAFVIEQLPVAVCCVIYNLYGVQAIQCLHFGNLP